MANALADNEWNRRYLRQAISIDEGFCPDHRVPLRPALAEDGPAGWHPGCGWWHHCREAEIVHWALDMHPTWRELRVPEWIVSYG